MDEQKAALRRTIRAQMKALTPEERHESDEALFCLLYTSDAADD